MAHLYVTRPAKAWSCDALVAESPSPGAGWLHADENNYVAFFFEPLSCDVLFIVNQSDHRDGWGWIDDAERALIVQRDISASHRRSKRAAGFGHTFNSLT